MTALADCNNFFVSCELLKNPDLKGKAVCVLSNCDGCVISRSNEAKKMGITMGLPLFMAKKQFPEAVYLSSDFKLYHDISKRIQKFLKNFSPNVEISSIDEAFLDVSGLLKMYNLENYIELGRFLHENLYEETGIPVSVGISTSKVLCKIATDKAKKGDFYYFIPFENIRNEIQDYPIENIWGIGRNTASLLRSYGIFTAGDILDKNKEFFQHYMGKRGLELKMGLAGEDVLPVCNEVSKPKSVQKTSSFPKSTNNKNFLKNSILEHLHNACRKIRRNTQIASEITVILRTKDFRVLTATDTVTPLTNSEYLLNKKVLELFEQIYSPYILYRSSGVYLGGLKDNEVRQIKIFENTEKFENLSKAYDVIEENYGYGAIKIGRI